MPILQRYNPQITEALVRTGRIAGDDLAFIDDEIGQLWGKIGQEQEGTFILDKERFLELPTTLKRHLLRTAIEKLMGNLKDIEARHIEEIIDALTKPAGKRLNLPGGLIFSIEYDRYLLCLDQAALSPFPILESEFPLKLPGETVIPGWHIEATILSRYDPATTSFNKRESNGIKGTGPIDNDFTAYFDFNKTGDKLVVRCRQPGDRFYPLGISQPKKLGEFMIDSKIPHAWRQRIPIVSSTEQILWVVGYRIDDRVKVNENTKQILRLKFERR